MKRGKLLQLSATGVALIIFVSGVVVAVHRTQVRVESPPEPRALAPAPAAVTMSTLGFGSKTAMGGTSPIRVEATGTDIDSVTLWEDDRAVATIDVPEGSGTGRVGDVVDWPALAPGPHVLHVSSHSDEGTAHSAPVAVDVEPSPATPPEVEVEAPAQTTPEAFAAAHGINPANVTRSGKTFRIDLTGVLTDVTDKTPIAPPAIGGSGVPKLSATLASCTAKISAKGTKGTLTVYETKAGSVGFTEVGTLKSGATLTVASLTPGVHVYVAGPEGEPTTTDPVSVVAPGSCGSSLWNGEASIIDGILTIPSATNQLFVVYLSVDDGPASRLPEDTLQLFRATTRHIDVRKQLPVLDGKSLHLEVWTVDPVANSTELMATGNAQLPEGMTPADLIGESTQTWLTIDPAQGVVADKVVTGTWSTRSARPDHVVWQVTTQPVDPSNPSLSPPGLVASGVATAYPDKTPTGGRHGKFSVPTSALIRPKMTPVASKPVSYAQLTDGKTSSNLPTQVAPIITDPHAIDLASLADSAVSDPEVLGGIAAAAPGPITGSTYFFRVLPYDGPAPLGAASESARFDGPPPTSPPQIQMTTSKAEFSGGTAANPALASCVRVTSVPWKGQNKNDFYSAFFPGIGTYCPGDWDADESCALPQFVCDVWDAAVKAVTWVIETAAKVWDVIALVYNTIVDTVVTLIAKLNPYCLAATAAAATSGAIGFDKSVTDTAKGAAKLCDKISKVATKAAVAAVMSSFGLPPELPTSQQLTMIAKGNLTELAVGYLEQLGIPCGDLTIDGDTAQLVSNGVEEAGGSVPPEVKDGVDVCRDTIGMVMGEVEKQVKGSIQSQIATSTGLPLPFAPIEGFEFEMEPNGQYTPPSFNVTATSPLTDPPPLSTCKLVAAADIGWEKKAVGKPWAFSPSTMNLQRIFTTNWRAGTGVGFNPAYGLTTGDQDLRAGTPIRGALSSTCLDDGKTRDFYGFVDVPLGRWQPPKESWLPSTGN